jgi:TolA-binding protein
MTVVGLHPEELFDKLQDGELSSPERERLHAHLEACAVCRFEYAARADFRAEALELAVTSPPPALPLRPLSVGEAEAEPGRASLPARRRRRLRRVVWGLAAAALITASGAVASGLVGKSPWRGTWLRFSQTAKPGSDERAALLPKKLGAAAVVVAAPPPATLAPSDAAVPAVAVAEPAPAAPGQDTTSPTQSAGRAHAGAKARAAVAQGTALALVSPSSGDMPSSKDAASKEPAAKEPPSAAKLFGEANQARRSGDVGRASGLYHLLQDQFPGSPEAELSRVTLALLLLDNGDAQAALSGFERYLAGSSRGLEAEALVGRARALGRLGRRNLEVSAWQEVQRKYPRSIYGRQATERLSALGLP